MFATSKVLRVCGFLPCAYCLAYDCFNVDCFLQLVIAAVCSVTRDCFSCVAKSVQLRWAFFSVFSMIYMHPFVWQTITTIDIVQVSYSLYLMLLACCLVFAHFTYCVCTMKDIAIAQCCSCDMIFISFFALKHKNHLFYLLFQFFFSYFFACCCFFYCRCKKSQAICLF